MDGPLDGELEHHCRAEKSLSLDMDSRNPSWSLQIHIWRQGKVLAAVVVYEAHCHTAEYDEKLAW